MGGSKKVTVGYKYYMGVHLALCHGPVDEVSEFIISDRSGWKGSVKSSGSIYVNSPNLFGGEDREGGVQGTVDVMMGEPDQEMNSYLQGRLGGGLFGDFWGDDIPTRGEVIPAFRGIVSLVFHSGRGRGGGSLFSGGWLAGLFGSGFYWTAMSPYFKAPWWRVKRTKKGWSRGVTWYPEKAEIGGLDMNPAHIVYECLTNLEWGMGYHPSDMDEDSFRAAADRLYDEGFGLSLLWVEQSTIQSFIQLVLNHCDGVLKMDIRTGKFKLNLIRNDYDIATIPELNKSNLIAVESYQRIAWGDTANEIVVKYMDREQRETTVAVQDLASIEAQGGLISATRDYPGIRDDALARRVAMRDLNNVSTPLAKVTLRCNRVAWDWDISDVFSLMWPKLGIMGVPFRIVRINKGDLVKGEITIEAIEDIFGLPTSTYVAANPEGWVDPISEPLPVAAARVMEAPWWDVMQMLSAPDLDYLPDNWAFAELLAVRPSSDAYNFHIHASPNNSNYEYVDSGAFVPSALLAEAMPKGESEVVFTITDPITLDEVERGTYFYIDNEAFAIMGMDGTTGQLTAKRGVLDTVPAAHVQGARLYFIGGTQGYDQTTRLEGESVYYKPLTTTGKGILPIATALPLNITFNGRAERPYPPGKFRVSGSLAPLTGVFAPTEVEGNVKLTWAHRDRLQQTVSLIGSDANSIGPEPGTTYSARLLRADNNGVLVTQTGITGTTVTLNSDYEGQVKVELWSVRDGMSSWQRWNHSFYKYAGPIAAPTNLTGTYQE